MGSDGGGAGGGGRVTAVGISSVFSRVWTGSEASGRAPFFEGSCRHGSGCFSV